MEILVIVLLLTSMDTDSDLMQKLRSALQFYRENRELIAMFQNAANRPAPPPPAEDETEQPAPEHEKESRPSDGKTDSMRILEEYLKRSAV